MWLQIQTDLGLAPRTIKAYARGLADYLAVCEREGNDPLHAGRVVVASYVRDLAVRPNRGGPNVLARDSGVGLANATLQQRLVPVRLFYDYLIEEARRETNPVGRGRYTPGRAFGGQRERGLVPRFTKLPWIPSDEQWGQILEAARVEPLRNRFMLALAYDAALRREELCLLRTDDPDPALRMLRVRAETSKNRRERVVPYSAATGELLRTYPLERRTTSAARGQLFLSQSHRNHAAPITALTWSKVIRAIAGRAGVPRFSTHTLRHLCLTDLARAGWELHTLATFAGHRSLTTRSSTFISQFGTWRASWREGWPKCTPGGLLNSVSSSTGVRHASCSGVSHFECGVSVADRAHAGGVARARCCYRAR